MKSIFTLTMALFLFINISAQDLSYNMIEIEITETGLIDYGDLVLTNNSAEDIEIAVTMERICLNGDDNVTVMQFCIGTALCFQPVNETTTWGQNEPEAFLIIPAGQSDNSFAFKPFPPNGTTIEHGSEWNLVAYDRNNPDTKATINVVVMDTDLTACTPASVTDFNYQIGKAYPNPAFEFINIPYQIDANEANLNIYTSTGTLVKTVAVSPHAEQVEVNVADFTSGIYFYNITDGKEQSKMMSFMR